MHSGRLGAGGGVGRGGAEVQQGCGHVRTNCGYVQAVEWVVDQCPHACIENLRCECRVGGASGIKPNRAWRCGGVWDCGLWGGSHLKVIKSI
eukprot:663629-Prorocentrum_minimum.AAC.2